jgi:hypothetical protein
MATVARVPLGEAVGVLKVPKSVLHRARQANAAFAAGTSIPAH